MNKYMGKYKFLFAICVCFIVLGLCKMSIRGEDNSFKLTDSEITYLESFQNKVITIDTTSEAMYYNTRDNEKIGMLIPIADFLTNQLHLNIKINYETNKNIYEKLDNKEIDILGLQEQSLARKEDYFCTDSLYQSQLTFITRTRESLVSITNLFDKKIGLISGTNIDNYIVTYQSGTSKITYYDTINELLDGLENGQVDVCILTTSVAPTEVVKRPNIQYEVFVDSTPVNYVLYSSKDEIKPLFDIINRYITTTKGKNMLNDIEEARRETLLEVTRDIYIDDIKYLRSNYQTILNFDSGALYPLSFLEDKEYKGMQIEINDVFHELTGVEIKMCEPSDFENGYITALEKIKTGEIQSASGGYLNPKFSDDKAYNYSIPIWNSAIRMYSYKENIGDDLHNLKVGTTTNAVVYLNWEAILGEYPIVYNSRQTMLKALMDGEIDVAFMSEMSFDYEYTILKHHNLKLVNDIIAYAQIHTLLGAQNKELNNLYNLSIVLHKMLYPESRTQWELQVLNYKFQYIEAQNKLIVTQEKEKYFFVILGVISVIFITALIYLLNKYISYDRQISYLIKNQQSFDIAFGNIKTKKLISKGKFPLNKKWGFDEMKYKVDFNTFSKVFGLDFFDVVEKELSRLEKYSNQFDVKELTITSSETNKIYYYKQYLHKINKRRFMICSQDITEEVNIKNELKHIASTDFLSGLLTRRAADELIRSKISDYVENATKINAYFILFDIDDFKKINDTYGHDIGDIVIKTIANIIQNIEGLKETSRWGGEEFLSVIEAKDDFTAIKIAQNVINEISKKEIKIDTLTIKMTASAGVAKFNIKKDYMESVRLSDEALYQAKLEGKNCVRKK